MARGLLGVQRKSLAQNFTELPILLSIGPDLAEIHEIWRSPVELMGIARPGGAQGDDRGRLIIQNGYYARRAVFVLTLNNFAISPIGRRSSSRIFRTSAFWSGERAGGWPR